MLALKVKDHTAKTVGQEYPAGSIKRDPLHPGLIVKSTLERNGVSPARAIIAMKIGSKQAFYNVLSGSSAISTEMALRIGTYFGNGAEIWLRMQVAYDLCTAEKRMHKELAQIEPLRAAEVA